MTHDELLAKIDYTVAIYEGLSVLDTRVLTAYLKALRAVVKLIQKKQKFLEETKSDIPMTNQQLGAREERTKLLAEIKQVIEEQIK